MNSPIIVMHDSKRVSENNNCCYGPFERNECKLDKSSEAEKHQM